MSKVQTHYDNLKVMRDAPVEVIRAAYRTLTQKYHPDRNPGDERAARIMVILNKSYEVLCDPEARREHDEWIRRQEGAGQSEAPRAARPAPPRSSGSGVRLPRSGTVATAALIWQARDRLMALAQGKVPQTVAIPLGGIKTNIFLIVLALAALVLFGYLGKTGPRWTAEIGTTYMQLMLAAGAVLGINAYYVWRWYWAPTRPTLIVTPLYLMKTDHKRLWFWPLSDVEVINVSHHHSNGSYNYTSLSLKLEGKAHAFIINSEAQFKRFAEAFPRCAEGLNTAAREGDQAYVDRHIEFADVPTSKPAPAIVGVVPLAAAAALGLPIGFFAYLGADALNDTQPAAPQYSRVAPAASQYSRVPPAAAQPTQRAEPPAEPVDHLAKLYPGSSFNKTGYLRKEEKLLATGGLSTVTVDNSKNDADVLVKLVSLDGAMFFPVRVFYLRRGESFTMNKVKAGQYDVRYLERWTGMMAKSEPFDIEQVRTAEGTSYSQMTLTLYKVADGNMETFPISESEF